MKIKKPYFSEMQHPIGTHLSENLPYIKAMTKLIRKHPNLDNLVLVCRGSSGAIISSIIAINLVPIPPIVYLRKDGELGHTHFNRSYLEDISKEFVVVDDFIASGETINNIVKTLKEYDINHAGLCLSGSSGLDSIEDPKFFTSLYLLEKRPYRRK